MQLPDVAMKHETDTMSTAPVHVLYVFSLPIQVGGHYKSALAFARTLIKRGYFIHVVAPDVIPAMRQEFESNRIAITTIPELSARGRLPAIRAQRTLADICHKYAIQLIHAQDFHAIAPGLFCAIRHNTGFVYTKAGGPVNECFPPRTVHSVFYSTELYTGMISRWGLDPARISVIAARIDTTHFSRQEPDPAFMAASGIPPTGLRVAMAVRLAQDKAFSIDAFFSAAHTLQESGRNATFILAGDGPLAKHYRNRAAETNDAGGTVQILLIGPLYKEADLCALYNCADIVAGSGRGILEAMACSRPIIILGRHERAALLTEQNIGLAAQYNFSGRHFAHTDDVGSTLAELIVPLADNPAARSAAENFSGQYIQQTMDARIGTNALANIYQTEVTRRHRYRHLASWYAQFAVTLCRTKIKNMLHRLQNGGDTQ